MLKILLAVIAFVASCANAQSVSSECILDDEALASFVEQEAYKYLLQLYDSPVVELLGISLLDRKLALYSTAGGTFESTLVSGIDLNPGETVVSDDNILAYVPSYEDKDKSGLGTGFINLEKLFPCIAGADVSKIPRCTTSVWEEDGFNKGKAVIDIADNGKKLDIFGNVTSTYAFAVSDCPEFTGLKDGCLHKFYDFGIVCYLPRSQCTTVPWHHKI